MQAGKGWSKSGEAAKSPSMHPRGQRCAAGATDTGPSHLPWATFSSTGPALCFPSSIHRILLCTPTRPACLLLSNLALSTCVLFLLFCFFCCTHRSWCNPRSHSAAAFNNTCTTLPRLPTSPAALSNLYITPFSAAFLFMPRRP